MIIRNKYFDANNKTYIMGILNITMDSFSDGGKYSAMDDSLFHVEEMLNFGADIIDIGGESTRPGYTMIDAFEEIERVLPVIRAVRERFGDVVLSLDTYKSEVAEAGLSEGVDIINDIWGLKFDSRMGSVIKKHDASVVLTHNDNARCEHDIMEFVVNGLNDSLKIAYKECIDKDRIIIDPGIGFAKTYEENLKVIKDFSRLKALGFPILIGASNKSVIGNTLNLAVGERLEGTLAVTAYSVLNRASFVRVHDVRANKRVIDMLEAVLNI